MKFATVLRQRRIALTKAKCPQAPKPFPFFDLPVELREQIYDDSLENHSGSLQDDGSLHYRAHGMPALNLLLASKQVKQEYETRARRKQVVHIIDTFKKRIEGIRELPCPAIRSPRTTFSIIVSLLCAMKEFEMHLLWLPKLLRQVRHSAHLQLDIKLARNYMQAKRELLDYFVQRLYTNFDPTFHLITKTHVAERDGDDPMKMTHESTALLVWSQEKKKLEDIIEGSANEAGT